MVDIEHHAIADVAVDSIAHDARRHQIELVDLVADNQGMAGIVPPLKTHDPGCMIRQPIDDLPLPFVAPLCADNDDILSHIDSTLFIESLR